MPDDLELPPGNYVLDTHAIFALLQKEAGYEIVASLIERAADDVTLFLSIINFGEIAYITQREQGKDRSAQILADVRRLPIALYESTETRVLASANIKAQYAVSYADAFAIALAQELGATLVSGDPEMKSIEPLVKICWIR
ncbi:MAG: type II toxin-antitoxin system VapC family toxin [Chloroflexi bacterium]|nr:type II toxin-antitoxin system VapC family toxin [Chloroflexota bacterium]MBI5080560.1 type II toxin-antitoxin system VapC family toxin [Chloroflexota bacterium]MBI5715145.1 type II toxin-antitoxin system VapC family toxin [Chloroflexota bacterium]